MVEKNTTMKHVPTGLIFRNRKEAIYGLGRGFYKKALKNSEFEFDYHITENERIADVQI